MMNEYQKIIDDIYASLGVPVVIDDRSNVKFTYKGWNITAYHQVHIKPFLEYVAIARKEEMRNGVLTEVGFNKEGNSLNQAVQNIIKEINNGRYK